MRCRPRVRIGCGGAPRPSPGSPTSLTRTFFNPAPGARGSSTDAQSNARRFQYARFRPCAAALGGFARCPFGPPVFSNQALRRRFSGSQSGLTTSTAIGKERKRCGDHRGTAKTWAPGRNCGADKNRPQAGPVCLIFHSERRSLLGLAAARKRHTSSFRSPGLIQPFLRIG